GAAAATIPATMAMGFGMAQEMMKSMQTGAAGTTAATDPFSPAAAQAAPATGGLQVLTPAQAAQVLGVAEADVMAEIQAGNLKARQIGSQWRIAQAALEDFLRG
ncbi:MAG: helix-turn-helix domain-containing protein, partial [Comamonas sp.]